MSRASVARALQERAERLARSAWAGAKTGAEGAYRAGAGLVGAPQGPSHYRDAIAAVESRGSGDYQARGPRTRSGDRAYGRYQVMGANIPSWTQQALGYQMTPQQFLADQSAQDKVFDTVFGGYLGRGSPQDAISRWFTGQPLAVGKYRADVNGMTGNRYVDKVMGHLGQQPAGSITARGSQVEALQRDLNSRGAQIKVDGLLGPLTRAAQQQFLGSPTSVRTPSFTAAPTKPATPQTPAFMNPYTSTTGGAAALTPNARQVPTVAVQSAVRSKSPLPSYYDSQTAGNMTTAGGRAVPTAAGYAPTTGPVLTGGFSPPRQAPVPQTPSFMNPYTNSNGGANAIVQPTQTARMPQPRPNYQPPQQAAPAAQDGTMMQIVQAQMQRAAAVAAQVAERAKESYSQGMRSGMGYGGGGYSAGGYGGAGGRSIASGVGGAFRSR